MLRELLYRFDRYLTLLRGRIEARALNVNRQYYFDRAYVLLMKQGKGAIEGDNCKYRAPDGSMCALGQFIPDSKYSPHFDRVGIGMTTEKVINTVGLNIDLDFAQELQKAHDMAAMASVGHTEDFKDFFTCNMKNLANKFKLKFRF